MNGSDKAPRRSPPGGRGLVFLSGNAYLLLTVTTLLWGAHAVAGRMSVGEVSPMAMVMLRWFAVTVLVLIFARARVVAEWPVLRRHLPYLFLMGGLGFTGFNAFYYISAQSTEAINIGILQGAIPIFVFLGAYAVYHTTVTWVQAVGVAFTLAGVIMIAAQGEFARLAELRFNIGDLLMIVACALYAAFTIALQRRPAVSGLAMFAVMAVAAFVTSLPLGLFEILTGAIKWPTLKGWGIIAFVAILPSFIAQLCFLRGVELIGPPRAGVFTNLVPIFAAILSVWVLGESFEYFHGFALLLILGGIWLAERAGSR